MLTHLFPQKSPPKNLNIQESLIFFCVPLQKKVNPDQTRVRHFLFVDYLRQTRSNDSEKQSRPLYRLLVYVHPLTSAVKKTKS